MGKLFPTRENLVSDIPAGDGNTANPFFTVYHSRDSLSFEFFWGVLYRKESFPETPRIEIKPGYTWVSNSFICYQVGSEDCGRFFLVKNKCFLPTRGKDISISSSYVKKI